MERKPRTELFDKILSETPIHIKVFVELNMAITQRIYYLSSVTGKPIPDDLQHGSVQTLKDIAKWTEYFGEPILMVYDTENNVI